MCIISKKCTCTKSNHFTLTLNNYQEKPGQIPRDLPDLATYMVLGKEIGEQGTPHLQAYIQFSRPIRKCSAILKLGLHWTVIPSKGNDLQNFNYCTKDNDYTELGTRRMLGHYPEVSEEELRLISHMTEYYPYKFTEFMEEQFEGHKPTREDIDYFLTEFQEWLKEDKLPEKFYKLLSDFLKSKTHNP